MSTLPSDLFIVRISGNPSNISLVLNKVDPVNADLIYPLYCLDGYHFEDATVTCSIDERSGITISSVVKSNTRGSL